MSGSEGVNKNKGKLPKLSLSVSFVAASNLRA
jgi:hypothetical protein